MTGTEVEALLPRLKRLSKKIAFNCCDADDLLQQTALVLLENRRQYRSPVVLAVSVMIDYCRVHGFDRLSCRNLRRRSFWGWEDVAAAPPKDCANWRELQLTEKEKTVVWLCCELAMSKREAAQYLAMTEMQVIRTLRKAAIKAEKQWV